jgi:hypothetical protein
MPHDCSPAIAAIARLLYRDTKFLGGVVGAVKEDEYVLGEERRTGGHPRLLAQQTRTEARSDQEQESIG